MGPQKGYVQTPEHRIKRQRSRLVNGLARFEERTGNERIERLAEIIRIEAEMRKMGIEVPSND